MNKGLNAIKNIIWVLGIMASVVALLIGIVFSLSHRFYGDRLDGTLDIRGSKVTVVKPNKPDSAQGAPDGTLAELNSTQDAGIEYVFSLTYLCDSTIMGLNDYASSYNSAAKANMWSAGSLPAANASDTMITSPSDGSQIIPGTAAMVYQPKRMVIYLGGDGLAGATQDSFINGYTKLIKDIQASSPNTSIVCCSIGSIAAAYTGSDGLTVEQFAQANAWIKTVCRNTGVQFADLASILNGDNGYLKVEYAAPDGRSLNSAGINELISYFRLHASV